MNLNEIFVGEYSIKQNAFHIEKLTEMCSINKRLILEKTFIDYLPIVAGTYTEVRNKLDEFKEKIREEK